MSLLAFVVGHPLNAGRTLPALWHALRWQLASRLAPGDIVYPWIGGSKFLVRGSETGLTGNIYGGQQEYAEMAFLLHLLRPGDLFVDIGANVGSFPILAGAVAGAKVCAIEPVPATFGRLLENMRINHLDDAVQCVNMGIGSSDGVLRFSSDMDVGNRALADGEQRAGGIEVPATTLDALLAGRSPRLLKIDVEGYEAAVLAGAGATLRDPGLLAVIMEINGSGEKYGFDEAQLYEAMAAHGFQACDYLPPERRLVPVQPGARQATDNAIFVRDLDAANARVQGAAPFTVHGRQV
jgi:FkbM family methyltransferase